MKTLQHNKNFANLTASILVLMSLAFVGCKRNGTSEGNAVTAYPNGTVVEAPDNLVDYFDSLLSCTPAFIYTRNVDYILPNPDSLAVLSSIKALDDYQAHRTSVFPRKQVADALGHMIFAQWDNDTHGGCEEDGANYSELFFFRYLEQVTRLCPHVDYLTHIHTGDDKAGIFTGHEFSEWHQPYYCILLYRHGGGYRTKFLQHYNGYDRIRELSDSAGRSYLLCYNLNTDYYLGETEFKAILFLEEDGDYEEVCNHGDWIDELEYDDEGFCVDYNPKTMTWTRCRQKDGKKLPVDKKKRLRLSLDGKKSCFELCD